MKKNLTLALATLLAVGFAGQASAQYGKPIGASFRVGLFYPTNGEARDVEGRGWFGGGLDYKIADLNFSAGETKYSASWGASVDYYGKGSFTNVPLLVNYYGRVDQFYYVGGAGIGFTRVPNNNGGSSTATDFTFRMGLGYDFVKVGTPFFLELDYFGCNESKLNGFGVYAGIRF